MNCGIFIPVRTGSTRLPKKALRSIENKCILEYLIERVKYINENLANIFICTTNQKEDYILDEIAQRNGIKIYHGDTKNIIKRQYDCAVDNNIEIIVNVDGDDIFCNPEYIKKILQIFDKNSNYDVIKTEDLPFGTNSMAYKRTVLEKVLNNFDNKIIETGWGQLICNNSMFNIEIVKANAEEKLEARLTLDYEDDFEMFKNIIENLFFNKDYIYQQEIISYLKNNPEVRKINYHLNETYWKNFENKKSEERRC